MTLPIAVSMGDPAGIGPDIVLSAWRERVALRLPPFAVYGDAEVFRARAQRLGIDAPVAVAASLGEVASVFAAALPIRPVRADAAVSIPVQGVDVTIVAAIEEAAAAAIRGEALAVVTNPIVKRTLSGAHLKYPGHTEFLGLIASRHCGGGTFRPVMMLASEELKVVPATVHVPLRTVPGRLTRALLVDTMQVTATALEQDFGITRPRLAVTGLNPHAGESGLIGSEEADIIAPAIAEMAAQGLAVTGPHSADTLFHAEARRTYDAVIAMYHDQALIPLKTLAFDRGVNVTLGLPFVRTSPDHGTAFALAGTGKARPGSFIAALRLAREQGQRRLSARSSTPT